ncbi:hypothetical protein MMC13_005667 [Lambiella insularis]|nr:hypothetical protein [Lambiella insularis]
MYDYRIATLQANVNALQKQRDMTIDKLKAATKYNSTQQLLEKYGGSPSKPKASSQTTRKSSPNQSSAKSGRLGFVPPATANIPSRNIPASLPSTPQRSSPLAGPPGPTPPFTAAADSPPWRQQSSPVEETAEFAPNAFPAAPQYIQVGEGSRWYDRFMDVLLGEDETLPKNRIVLICKKCRLVNGQAPPGVKQLEDAGTWRCSGCGTMNGEENEAKKLVADIKRKVASNVKVPPKRAASPTSPSEEGDEEAVLVGHDDSESDVTQYTDENLESSQKDGREVIAEEQAEQDPVMPRRGRPKGSGKKRT